MVFNKIGASLVKSKGFQEAVEYMAKKGVTKTPTQNMAHCKVQYEKIGDRINKIITKDNGTVMTGSFDANGQYLGLTAKSSKGTYSVLNGDGYKLESAHLNSEHPLSGLDRVTTKDRSAYAEARKFYNDHKEWHGIESDFSNVLLDCKPNEIKTNTWSRGTIIPDFTLKEARPSYGCARAQLNSPMLGRYTCAPFGQMEALDNTLKRMKVDILG